MARVFTDGAEMGDLLFWSVTSGTVTNITTSPRSGTRHYSLSNSNVTKNIVAVAEGWFRAGISFAAVMAHTFVRWSKGATVLGSVRLNATTSRLEIWISTGTLVATSVASLSTSTYYLIEVHIRLDNSGAIDVRVDGADFVSFAGDTTPGADTTFDNLYLVSPGVVYLDDLAFNDASGSADNSWCGDGKIVMLSPNGNGDLSQLMGSDLNSVDNYLLVDEVPPNSDTDYVASATTNQADLYAMTTTTIPTKAVVKRVFVEARAREEVASGDSIKLGIKTNSVEYWSGSIVQSTSYTRSVGPDYLVNPQTGSAWTQGEIDALQAGVKIG
jgi:hypothetical protein